MVSKEHSLSPSSSKSFRHIIFIIIESAAIYSIFLLADAIINVLPSTASQQSVSGNVGQVVQQFKDFATGIAPTILVARVAMAQMKTEETRGGSDFGHHATSSNRPPNSLFNRAEPEANDKPKSTNMESD
uniref:Uncharacterized protein n=1 Tax=Psilocybe cubensis TaxID=181762 RepID=A0A8H7XNM1_PSICU